MFKYSLILLSLNLFSQNYQIGPNWSREEAFNFPQYFKIRESIASVGYSATGFYIGSIQGKHYVVTNNHVCPSTLKCSGRTLEFFYKKNRKHKPVQAKIVQVSLNILKLDLSLLEIEFQNVFQNGDLPFALQFEKRPPPEGLHLLTMGYGMHHNEYGTLTLDHSNECKVFSKNGDLRMIKDPDTENPLNYRVFSFLMSCDASHGDSGSPVLDKRTGKVIGLLWTGKVPKLKRTSSNQYLTLPYELKWQEFNFASPSFEIVKALKKYFQQ